MDNSITFQQFRDEWIEEIITGNPSTVELGRRFAKKLLVHWLELDESSDDIVYCDGSGDGGIDIAYLSRKEVGEDTSGKDDIAEKAGDTWFLVQSKYGSAFSGTTTLLKETQKIMDTLDGHTKRLSSLSEVLLERLKIFRSQASESDKLTLVFAIEEPLTEAERRTVEDIRVLGRNRLGTIFDVEEVSIDNIYQRNKDSFSKAPITFLMKAKLDENAGEGVLVGTAKLMDLYDFLKEYRAKTGELDRLYEKNVRRFLGLRGKVNKAIKKTLLDEPERFGLYNNGITIVVQNYDKDGEDHLLGEPYIVNGCQTTRTIWEVLFNKLESGGRGTKAVETQQWLSKLKDGMVIIKVVKVGTDNADLLREITQFTNTQNAIREKDFLALTSSFQQLAREMANHHNIFLEIQRGGWESQKAYQKQNSSTQQFKVWVNAFDLIKVFGAGWIGEVGTALAENSPFLPNGTVFKQIMDSNFALDDLYAAYLLYTYSNKFQFGRAAEKPSRGPTRFLFYRIVVELLKSAMTEANIEISNQNITKSLLKLFKKYSNSDKENPFSTVVICL